MLNLKKAAFGAVTVALMFGAMAAAQTTGGRVPQPGPKVETGSTGPVMNIDQVGNMLRGLGYQVRTVTRQNGLVIHELDLPYKGKTVPVDVGLSGDGTKVWLTVVCSPTAVAATIPANVTKKLLEVNAAVGPNHFVLAKSGYLVLQSALDNRNLPSDQLKRQIDLVCLDYADFENLWNPTKWGTVVGSER